MPEPELQNINKPIPEWKLELSYFYVEHKVAIKRLLVFLIFFADLIIVFLLGSILLNYQTGLITDEYFLSQMPSNLVEYHDFKSTNQPTDLKIIETQSIKGDKNNYDLITIVENNNKKWAVTAITYSFDIGQSITEPRTTFILPRSQKYLTHFNIQNAANANLKIINTKWKRIEDYTLLSYQDSVNITNSYFESSRSTKTNGQVILTIFNDSPYSFWEVGLAIALYDKNSNIIGIDYTTINKLLSKEERQIKVGWPYAIQGSVSRVEVIPEINFLDQSSVMKLDSPPGSPPGRE